MTKIKPADLRKTGIGTCKQAREWCKRNNISYSDFKDGIDVERVRHIQDGQAMIQRAIKAAEEREARNGR